MANENAVLALSLKKNVLSVRIFAFLATIILAFGLFAALARADITPSLSLTPNSDGNSVTLNVFGGANEGVELFYSSGSSGSQVAYLGLTSSSGYLSAVVSSSQYNIVSGSPVHVAVGGIAGTPSATVAWPTVSGTSTSGVTLSQSSMTVAVGQSNTITATNTSGSSLYLYSNSNSPVANVSINGNSITVNGLTNGSTTITICPTTSITSCPSLYVLVQNSGAQSLYLSQSSITLAPGASVPVTMSGGNGVYTVYNNPNASLVYTSIVGNTVTLSTSSTSGTDAVTLCSTDMSACGIINVTIGTSSSSAISFTQTNPIVPLNQSMSVGIMGGTGSYYISSPSNNIVTASISGATLTLYGLTNGSTTITVCSSAGGCGSLTATTNYVSTGGVLSLSQSSLSLAAGQTMSITISGGTAPYSVATPSGPVYSTSISGNILTVQGLSSGSTQIAVCSASGGCTWLSLIVSGTSVSSGSLSLSQSSLTLSSGQTSTVSIYGSGTYYISNGSSSVASASISGSAVIVTALSTGTTTVTVCQNGSGCIPLYVSVNTSSNTTTSYGQGTLLAFGTPLETLGVGQSATVPISGGSGSYYIAYASNTSAASASVSGNSLYLTGQQSNSVDVITVCSSANTCGALPVAVGTIATTTTTSTVTTTTSGGASDGYVFTNFLTLGTESAEVAELQKRLGALGYFSGNDTGYFGALTEQAVKAFQSAHGIAPVGYVGPSTRTALNNA